MIAFGNLEWQLFAGTRDELKIEIQREEHQTSQMVVLNLKYQHPNPFSFPN